MAKILAFAGSLRKQSQNKKLLALTVDALSAAGAEVTVIDLNDFELPFYNQDIQDQSGFPEAAEKLKALVESHDALVIVTPEYNYSFPAVIKNVIDWLSRYRPHPFRTKHALLLSASPGMVGGNRAVWALRVPLEMLGVHVYPDMFSLAQSSGALDEDGNLKDEALANRLTSLTKDFVVLVDKVNA